MLVHKGVPPTAANLDTIHNYYEHLVLERIVTLIELRDLDTELVADIACVALNHLPPRYIRFDVDMAFYLSPNEYEVIEEKVITAVDQAIQFVEERGKRYK